MNIGNGLRIASYMSLCGVLLFLVPMQPLAELQPILRVPQDYPTIQAAVDAAPAGAIILIDFQPLQGIYYEEAILINRSACREKPLDLRGNNPFLPGFRKK